MLFGVSSGYNQRAARTRVTFWLDMGRLWIFVADITIVSIWKFPPCATWDARRETFIRNYWVIYQPKLKYIDRNVERYVDRVNT